MRVRLVVVGFACLLVDFWALGRVEARDVDDCKRTWARAVRSYVARDKGKAGPNGVLPQTLDDEERVAQDWLTVFSEACALEEEGNKAGSRLEAALAGARALIQVDPPACSKFMRYYMGSSKPQDVCDMLKGQGSQNARRTLESSIPRR